METKNAKREREEQPIRDDEEQKSKRVRNVMKVPTGVCVKVASLRPKYSDLKQWCGMPKHLLVTRHGRIFIGKGDKKTVFTYPASEWANPFPVKKYGLNKSLEMFEKYLDKKLSDTLVRDKFLGLSAYDELGCFCNQGERCHRDIIINKLCKLMQSADK